MKTTYEYKNTYILHYIHFRCHLTVGLVSTVIFWSKNYSFNIGLCVLRPDGDDWKRGTGKQKTILQGEGGKRGTGKRGAIIQVGGKRETSSYKTPMVPVL